MKFEPQIVARTCNHLPKRLAVALVQLCADVPPDPPLSDGSARALFHAGCARPVKVLDAWTPMRPTEFGRAVAERFHEIAKHAGGAK